MQTEAQSPAESLDKVREIIVGRSHRHVEQAIKPNSQAMVSNVVSEALHQRELKDGSVNKVLVPLIEKSLHSSIETNKDKIAGTLYPLVGSMVRKAVASFLTDFIERTNTLLENSLSFKSVGWRIKARRSGIKYSEYVASQVYQFKVDQLLVIHRETGTLLQAFTNGHATNDNADLISAMLVAINDFVADAFSEQQNENELGEIKTGEFSLLIKIGPQALLVAAATGNVSPELKANMQRSLEDFHKYFRQQLVSYNGDNAVFENCFSLFSNCLLSEKKPSHQAKKTPVIGIFVLGILLLGLAYFFYLRIELNVLKANIRHLSAPAGIVITGIDSQQGQALVSMLRDPYAQSPKEWLRSENINTDKVIINESPYVSLHSDLILAKVKNVMKQYPSINYEIANENNNSQLIFFGDLNTHAEKDAFSLALDKVDGIEKFEVNLNRIAITKPFTIEKNELLQSHLLTLSARISSSRINFAKNSALVETTELSSLEDLANSIIELNHIAESLGRKLTILVLGASDSSGNRARNVTLSQERAGSVINLLKVNNVPANILQPVVIGELSFSSLNNNRVVVFHILLADTINNEDMPL